MAYSGMPSHYPHWSYGKSYEKLKTLYDYGVSGLPYEMVINSNPALAYLMRDNSLCLQILTIAHVYGHNDFFKNNFTFKTTRAEFTHRHLQGARRPRAPLRRRPVASASTRSRPSSTPRTRSRSSAGATSPSASSPTEEERERLLDAAAAARPIRSSASTAAPEYVAARPAEGPARRPTRTCCSSSATTTRTSPTGSATCSRSSHEEARYFIPQIETKIMNEGWASCVHREILNALELPQDLHLEFLVRHNQVVRPIPGGLNPYHLGLKLWEDIEAPRRRARRPRRSRSTARPARAGMRTLFETREVDRDVVVPAPLPDRRR